MSYIKREDAVGASFQAVTEIVCALTAGREIKASEKLYECIDKIPSADVQPVVHGKWIKHENPKGVFSRECSVCHVWLEWDMPRNSFCPNCGSYNGGKNGT